MAKRSGPPLGRPTLTFTDEDRAEVRKFAGYGMSQERLSKRLGCSVETLVKNFEKELREGVDDCLSTAVSALFGNIRNGDTGAICFYLKTQHQWKEKSAVELSGVDGAPLSPVINIGIAGKK